VNIKKYIYEFFGFAIFYSCASLIFGFDSTVICIVAGIIGAIGGKFISKVNGFFINEVIDHEIVNENDGSIDIGFTLKADYKTKPIVLFGYYSANKIIDTETLSILLYNKIHDSHYKQILKNGVTKINVRLKEGTVEIKIKPTLARKHRVGKASERVVR
jgi:uncharacterized membrane protein